MHFLPPGNDLLAHRQLLFKFYLTLKYINILYVKL